MSVLSLFLVLLANLARFHKLFRLVGKSFPVAILLYGGLNSDDTN